MEGYRHQQNTAEFLTLVQRQLQYLEESNVLSEGSTQRSQSQSYIVNFRNGSGAYFEDEAATVHRRNVAFAKLQQEFFYSWKNVYKRCKLLREATELFEQRMIARNSQQAVTRWCVFARYSRQVRAKSDYLRKKKRRAEWRYYLSCWIDANTSLLYRKHLQKKHVLRTFEAWYSLTIAERYGRRTIMIQSFTMWAWFTKLQTGLRFLMRRKQCSNNRQKAINQIQRVRAFQLIHHSLFKWKLLLRSIVAAKTILKEQGERLAAHFAFARWSSIVASLREKRRLLIAVLHRTYVVPVLSKHFAMWKQCIAIGEFRRIHLQRSVLLRFYENALDSNTFTRIMAMQHLTWLHKKRIGLRSCREIGNYLSWWKTYAFYQQHYRQFHEILLKLLSQSAVKDWHNIASIRSKKRMKYYNARLQLMNSRRRYYLELWGQQLQKRVACKGLMKHLHGYFLRAAFGVWYAETGASRVVFSVREEIHYSCRKRVFEQWWRATIFLPQVFKERQRKFNLKRLSYSIVKWRKTVSTSRQWKNKLAMIERKKVQDDTRICLSFWRKWSEDRLRIRHLYEQVSLRIRRIRIHFAVGHWNELVNNIIWKQQHLHNLHKECLSQRRHHLWGRWQSALELVELEEKARSLYQHLSRSRESRACKHSFRCWKLYISEKQSRKKKIHERSSRFDKFLKRKGLRCWITWCTGCKEKRTLEDQVMDGYFKISCYIALKRWERNVRFLQEEELLMNKAATYQATRAMRKWMWFTTKRLQTRLETDVATEYHSVRAKGKYFHSLWLSCTKSKKLRTYKLVFEEFIYQENLNRYWGMWKGKSRVAKQSRG